MSQMPWDVLEFSNQSVQAAGMLQADCTSFLYILGMSIWMLFPNFSIPQMQWDRLEFSNHPVQAACALHAHCSVRMRPMHMCLRMSIWMLMKF